VPAPPPYNPAGFVLADPATWPQPIPPATLYQPGMAWTMTAAGVVDGQPVAAGDLLFAVHRPRLYGDFDYGSGGYGSPAGQDWTPADVAFLAWYTSAPPEHQPPFPYSGCKFGDTGWWLIIDAYYLDATDSRLYGDGTYGDGTYGGGSTATARWVDITAGYVDVTINRGNNDGAPTVDAIDIDVTWYDPDWSKWDLAPPAAYYLPAVGTPLRVSFYDPVWRWYPRAVGEIEQITDVSGAPPRFVTVQAFGHVMDLDRTLLRWQRPAETASARFLALLTAAGWRYGTETLVFPGDTNLHADPAPRDVRARDELDRTAVSAGWQFDTDLYGLPRLRTWPLLELGPVVAVVDCDDHGDPGVLATSIDYVADHSQLLNIVSATNTLTPPTVSQAVDQVSVAIYGGRDNALGFPATGLAFATQADGDALTSRVAARYSRIVTHVDRLAADTLVDPAWLPVLAGLDTGARLAVTRVHPDPWTLACIVVGADEQITPDRIETTVFTTTTTPT